MVMNCHSLKWLVGKCRNAYQMYLVLFINYESKTNSGRDGWACEKQKTLVITTMEDVIDSQLLMLESFGSVIPF